MPWYNPPPTSGQPITSTWGNAIENACRPIFATKAALDAGWTDAPDGAEAFVLANRKTYNRRGASWLLPLENTQGLMSYAAGPNGSYTPTTLVSPGFSLPGFDVGTLRGKRTYVVQMQARWAVTGAPAAQQLLGFHLNFAGTLNDVNLTWDGAAAEFNNGQEILAVTFGVPWQNFVLQQSWTGRCITGGTDDQVLTIRGQVVTDSIGVALNLAACSVSCVDVGPG